MSTNDIDPKRSLIATRLRAAREMAGLSQGQVARRMDVHRPTISEIEAGRRRVSADELRALAELYQVDVRWLAGQDNEEDTSDDGRVTLAARELAKLDKEDLDRVLTLLKALRK